MRDIDRFHHSLPAGFAVPVVPAVALGALACGAIAIGALAIARLAIREMAVKKTHLGSVEIDDLTVRRLRVIEHVHQPTDANVATPQPPQVAT